jgi:hypothetical protein
MHVEEAADDWLVKRYRRPNVVAKRRKASRKPVRSLYRQSMSSPRGIPRKNLKPTYVCTMVMDVWFGPIKLRGRQL